ncbi:protein kinase [Pseudonocardia nematodicida]|uniref:Protein kinase n=1 Tax=Pseudonocardia nematodicida TaxID=1206997 RepID=A0ABV1KDL0_9PSEU
MAAPDPPSPTTVGPYRLGPVLGAGASGRVHLAVDARGRRVALKLVHRERAAADGFRTRFRREVAAARRMPARWTAPVVDADPDGDPPWVATTLLEGPTLDRRVRDGGPLHGRELARLASGLLRAVAAMHRAGLVHRDLKPANVVLTRGGPRVVDFGIAHTAGDTRMTRTGATPGTPAYLAPEQVVEAGEPGPAADVHALGAVLVFAATGAPPYPGDTVPAVLYRLLHGAPDPGATPEPWRTVAAACLERDPARRPSAADLLARRRRGVGTRCGIAAAAVAALVAGVVALLPASPADSPGPVPSDVAADAGAGPVAPDPGRPGNGPPATAPVPPPSSPGPVVALAHRAGAVVAGEGRVYVADPDGGAVTALDTTGRVLGTVEVGNFPAALALSPDGTRLYAALTSTPTRVVAVDTADRSVVAAAEVGDGAAGAEIVWSPDLAWSSGAVVVGDPRTSRVVALDPDSLDVLATATPATRPVALDAAGDDVVLVTGASPEGGNRVQTVGPPWTGTTSGVPGPDDVADLAALPGGDVVLAVTGTGDGTPGLRLTGPDGALRASRPDLPATRLAVAPGLVYALDATAGTVTAVDAGTLATVAEIPGAGAAAGLAVAPDGRALYVAEGAVLRFVQAG